jgi:hypothetical protein
MFERWHQDKLSYTMGLRNCYTWDCLSWLAPWLQLSQMVGECMHVLETSEVWEVWSQHKAQVP